MRHTLLLGLFFCLACSQQSKTGQEDTKQISIITAGGTITEIVNALGMGDQIIATDITSTYPTNMQSLPSIGYRNQIKSEGILSLEPDWVIVEDGYINADVMQQLESVGLKVNSLKKPKKTDETKVLIQDLGKLLDRKTHADSLIQVLENDLKTLREATDREDKSAKVAFIMARGPETIFLAGETSFASTFIRMAGGEFIGLEDSDFKPLSPEALPALNPDFILLFDSSLQAMGGKEGLAKINGITATTAWEKGQIIGMDGNLISGFGPRVARAALDLHQQINL